MHLRPARYPDLRDGSALWSASKSRRISTRLSCLCFPLATLNFTVIVLKTSVNGRKRELHLKPTQEGIGAEKLVSAVHEAAGINKSAIDQNQATDKTASAPAPSAPALKPKSAPAPPPPKEAVAKAPKAATSSTPPKSKIAGPFRVRALDLSSSDDDLP